MSTDTLDRGLSLLRSATMSLESDPLYQDMKKEKELLLATCLHCLVRIAYSLGVESTSHSPRPVRLRRRPLCRGGTPRPVSRVLALLKRWLKRLHKRRVRRLH